MVDRRVAQPIDNSRDRQERNESMDVYVIGVITEEAGGILFNNKTKYNLNGYFDSSIEFILRRSRLWNY